MSNLLGQRLGQYELTALLGKGGMATVYRAKQVSMGRDVAVKVIEPRLADSEDFLKRFDREARVVASLKHPHILKVFDYGQANGLVYLVMELLDGGSLADMIRRKPIPLETVNRILEQVASALDYAHKQGILHRDLKPQNVLLDSEGNAHLTDFGIAKVLNDSTALTQAGMALGTPPYMSPEQFQGIPLDARGDIYALGIVLYEMLTGKVPFVGDTPLKTGQMHLSAPVPSARKLRSELPAEADLVIEKALAKNREQRYGTAIELAAAFKATLPAQTPGAMPVIDASKRTNPMPLEDLDASTQAEAVIPSALPSTPPQPPPTPPPVASTPAAASTARPQSSRAVTFLTIAVIILLLLLIGSGVFIVMTNNANVGTLTGIAVAQNNTQDAAAQAQTGTVIAIQSFTPTPTNTVTPSPTTTPTYTPNQTQTLDAKDLSTYRAGQTATQQQHLAETVTAVAGQTRTKVAQMTQTAGAHLTETANAISAMTATAEQLALEQTAESATQTEIAKPTATPSRTPTPTKRPTNTPTRTPRATRTPTPSPVEGYTGTPDEIISKLVDDGQLTAGDGNLLYQQDTIDITVDNDGTTTLNSIQNDVNVADFVLSAEVTWDAPDDNNACGFEFRNSGGSAATANFYIARITRQGTFQALAHDKNGFRQGMIKEDDNSAINVDDGATNQILLIGQGNTFRFFVNGKLTETFKNGEFHSGALGVIGSRFTGSSGLTCHFANLFAYELASGSGGGGNGNDTGLAKSLLSDNPDDIIQGLLDANVISGSPTAVKLSSPNVNLTTTANTFSVTPAEAAKLTDVVVSTDLTFQSTEAVALACGVFYNGTFPQGSFVTAFFNQSQKLYVYISKQNTFKGNPPILTDVDAPQVQAGSTNRVTLVVVGNKATLYINGILSQSFADQTFKSGQVGYIIVNTSNDPSLECDFANTNVWRLK